MSRARAPTLCYSAMTYRSLRKRSKSARRAHGIIQFNFVGTLAVDAVGVALASFGLLNPLLAAFIHVASELTFIVNSARLAAESIDSATFGRASRGRERHAGFVS